MSDALISGRRFKVFNLLDDFNLEALAIEVDTSLQEERVVRVFEQVVSWRNKPERILVDNGPEFTPTKFVMWCEEHHQSIGSLSCQGCLLRIAASSDSRPVQ